MTYDEALEFIYSRRKFQKSSGHERIERLLELMDNPHKRLRFVHVVGTNGKGSVCTAVASVLQSAGYVTGLFTSPFVTRFGERIRVDGEYIPESAVASITKLLKEKITLMEKEELHPTVFEVTTALAMCYFADMNCDAVVLEAGIGGGKDSTSVITRPVVAVITSVSLDHTEVLGETAGEIAEEKCGIIKGGCPVVSYPFESGDFAFTAQNKEAAETVKRNCLEKGSELFVPDMTKARLIKSDLSGNELYYDGLHLKTGQCGTFQAANIITAAEVCRVLSRQGYMISDKDIEKGIGSFFIPGRLECVSKEPLVLLDAGHNEGAMLELAKTLRSNTDGRRTVALCAFMKDKAYEKALSLIAPLCDKMVFTSVDPVRGEKPEVLCEAAGAYCKSTLAEPDTEKAYILALEGLCNSDRLIVSGSFYLVSEIRKKYCEC
ncbi:MAG: bifunctional folylpolyglutamate synthase/dihydrofolate synthase [Ruminococcaceae bacterium]|nr:bifunctional folylpolyglutamate synthase/dihydrofolate synthase [Oscillospiraceae bacterium]